MTGWQVGLFVSGFLLIDAIVVFTIVRAAAFGWNRFAVDHPPTEPLEPSETRRFQSFSIGMINLGFCVHVTVDEQRLHLTPILPMRWAGLRPASMPWEAIDLRPPGWRKRWRTARLGPGLDLHGPAWCLQLAERGD